VAIVTDGGKIVQKNDAIATGPGCCCGGGGGCGRCVVPPHDVFVPGNGFYRVHDSYAEPRWRTQAECERCRMCVEHLLTACDGSCPEGSGPSATPLVTLEFSAECGSGAAGTVTVGCGSILSATITNGGSGYATETITEPTLTATVSGGTGGVLSINGYTKLIGGPPFGGYYVPTGISVVSGGTGYTDNSPVTLSLGTGDEWAPSSGAPDITIRTKVDPPADEWTLTPYLTNGSGLVVSLTLERGEDIAGYGPIFWATSATVVNGGTGYAVDDEIDAAGSTTLEGNPCAVVVSSVDSNGAVTGLDVIFTGYHEGVDTGVISSVVISSNRASRKRTVSTCPVTVTIAQQAPSVGTGATITATVDSTPASPTFGRVTGLTVTNGGSGYVGLCERKTAVGSCDECSPRESPESATCDDTGGCPCGTWVVDNYEWPCQCCKWVNPQWGVVLYNPLPYTDEEVECARLKDKMVLIGSYFEAAGWTVTIEENWCPEDVSGVLSGAMWGEPIPFSYPDPENPCACGFRFRAECESCSRAYPAHIWTPGYEYLFSYDPQLGTSFFEARPFDLSQWVAMPIEDWQHTIHNSWPVGDHVLFVYGTSSNGFARQVYCETLFNNSIVVYKDPLGVVTPEFHLEKGPYPLANALLYGAMGYGSQYHGGGLLPGYYSRPSAIGPAPGSPAPGGVIYIPKCGVEITERARCVLAPADQLGTIGPVLDDTWATCCAECPPGYRCLFAADPLDGTTIEANPLP